MALVRRPQPTNPDEGVGLGSDQYLGPLKKVDEVKFDELRPTDEPPAPAAPAPAAKAPAPAAPAPAPAAEPAPAPPPVKQAPRTVGRLTAFADLGVPAEIAADPDAQRFFDYMRLFRNEEVPGGLHGLSYDRARQALLAGRWGRKFTIDVERLIAEGLVGQRALLLSRFYGMRPVYKAFAGVFANEQQLKTAICEDLMMFVKHLKPSNRFPPFAYRVADVLPAGAMQ